ncbi:hypothetical protein [Branchiibius sp. NY16-3462-2]|uniref:hypothetical protein n=1 Tax=Branchiibius sp. NY16-3462-2 TaxID=1807500 RepID=UPI0025C5B23A|nr:hypothetical protein [Branchiibius sp. NY16-3462-2]
MSLIEWTELAGEQTEALAALLVNREHPSSVRITPSKGDGGVDILHRDGDGPGQDVVYQVKKFHKTLTDKQKENVRESVDRLFTDPRWADLNVTAWRLVMPWDPTPEQEHWVRDLVHAHRPDIDVVWHGKTFLNGLAAKYPDVVDYYLHGGRERQKKAHLKLVALMGMENMSADAEPAIQLDRIGRAVAALNHDPLYLFDVHTGHGAPHDFRAAPAASSHPNLVMSAVQWVAPDHWVQIDIVARTAVATQLAPISITGSFAAPTESPEAVQQLQDFSRYGAPLDHDDLTFTGALTAPGGFGGPIENARVWLLPVKEPENTSRLRMDARDSAGVLIADLNVRVVERSHAVHGLRSVLADDDSDQLRIEIRADLHAQTTQMSLTFQPVAGQPVSVVAPVVEFVAACCSPNRIRIGNRDAWPQSAVDETSLSRLLDNYPEQRANWAEAAEVMRDLRSIQGRCREVINTLDLTAVTDSNREQWARVGELLDGEEIQVHIGDDRALFAQVARNAASMLTTAESFTLVLPFTVVVGNMNYTLVGNCTRCSRTCRCSSVETWTAIPG